MKTGKMKWFGKAAGAGVLALTMAAPALQAQSLNDHQRGDRNQTRQGQYDRSQQNGQSDRGQGQYDSNQNEGRYDRGQADRNQTQGRYDRNDAQSYDRGRSAENRNYRDNQRVNVQGRISSFSHERGGYRLYLDSGRDSYWVPETYFRGHSPSIGISISLGGIFRGGAINIDAVSWPGAYGRAYQSGFVSGIVERMDYRDGRMMLRDRDGRMITVEAGRGMRDVRRGDYVELSGDWVAGGLFRAERIDNIRGR